MEWIKNGIWKKFLSLMLCLCLTGGMLPAAAETPSEEQEVSSAAEKIPGETEEGSEAAATEAALAEAEMATAETAQETSTEKKAQGWSFDFTLRLNEGTLSPLLKDRLQGYGDLLDALRFQGTLALDGESYDLSLSIIPVDGNAAPIQVRIWGTEEYTFIESPLLGGDKMVLSNISLLEFSVKAYYHLGVPLYLGALMVPYVWKNALRLPISDWNRMLADMNENGVIPRKSIRRLSRRWAKRMTGSGPLQTLETALGLYSGDEDSVLAFFDGVYSWISAQRKITLKVKTNGDNVLDLWKSKRGGKFASIRHRYMPDDTIISIQLPTMANGMTPSFVYQTYVRQEVQSGQTRLLITREDAPSLLDLSASAEGLPLTWPADCASQVNVSLTGTLFPNVGFSLVLQGAADGSAALEIRKPGTNAAPGAAMVTLSGTFLPMTEDVTLPTVSKESLAQAVDILRVNDITLAAFVSRVLPSALSGMMKFLVGIPTSAVQTVLDDLTQSGILGMLLGD